MIQQRTNPAKNKLFALGRLKQGQMNKTEALYSDYLFSQLVAKEVLWYKFEGVKLRLADNTFYTPDFVVMGANGLIEMHEVKGARAIFTDDAKVKVKVAADTYPFPFVVVFPIAKNRGGGWEFDRYE